MPTLQKAREAVMATVPEEETKVPVNIVCACGKNNRIDDRYSTAWNSCRTIILTALPSALAAFEEAVREDEQYRMTHQCHACSGEGFIMEYDDAPGYLTQRDCGRCKNTGVEPNPTNHE